MRSKFASLCAAFVVTTALFVAPATAADIAWEKIQNGSIDAAFAKAKEQNKPLFLYWGAVWCPPCNQVKATVFSRKDFIAQTKSFIPVYLDGDAPGAQKIASQFNVRAYPTMILLKPDAKEITRLPGEADPLRYVQLLAQGVRSAIPMAALVTKAVEPKLAKTLAAKDWDTIAGYSWDLDDARLAAADQRAKLLRQLGQACPISNAVAKQRLLLKALALHDKDAEAPLKQSVDSLANLLKDPVKAKPFYDLFLFSSSDLLSASAKIDPQREPFLRNATSSLLDAAADDNTLSWNDRIQALSAKYDLLSEQQKKSPPAAWATQAKNLVRAADLSIKSKFERQSVIPSAADVLTSYGMVTESNQLLTNELPKSVAPYYHMLVLSANAKKQGDKTAALDWSQKAFETSEGPATRIQWGSGYVRNLIDLSPTDTARIEKAATAVIQGLQPTADTFYERNTRTLRRMGTKLTEWNKTAEQAAVLQRLNAQLAKVCVQIPATDPARKSCDSGLEKI
jgi:thioredoxin-related protein